MSKLPDSDVIFIVIRELSLEGAPPWYAMDCATMSGRFGSGAADPPAGCRDGDGDGQEPGERVACVHGVVLQSERFTASS